jgi:hypothetical protein
MGDIRNYPGGFLNGETVDRRAITSHNACSEVVGKAEDPWRRLSTETVLQPEDARFGRRVPLRIYFYNPYQECGGTSVPWGLCAFCDGSGMIKHAKDTILRIVPGARGGARYEVMLGTVGIGNLLVEARILLH